MMIYSNIKKYLGSFFNTTAAGIYMLIFAASIGIATFIENDFGTSSAQKVVFKAWWFELLLVLFSITLLVNIVKFRMIPLKKWALLTFHLSMIIIFIGAGVTRYFGYEGIMHIRENDSSNEFLSSETFLLFDVAKDGRIYKFAEPVLFATLGNNNWESSYQIGNDVLQVKVKEFVPNPIQVLEDSPQGRPTLKIVIAGVSGREEYYVSQGESIRIKNLLYNFTDVIIDGAINLNYRNDSLLINSSQSLEQMIMATQEKQVLPPQPGYYPLRLRSMYSDGQNNFVFGEFNKQGKTSITSEHPKVKNESRTALYIEASMAGNTSTKYVYGQKGFSGNPALFNLGNEQLAISYGAKPIYLPFSIKLYDFIMERYPGTNSAASYASEVQLIDNRDNYQADFRIYMNHILDYEGYRFFQSSFDQDEMGTYLSVNHDFWGTWISYLGYFLLTIGLIMSLFSKKSRFYQVSQKLKRMRTKTGTFIFIFIALMATNLNSQNSSTISPSNIISADHAEKFSKILVQDHKGRMKPIHTLSRELMRKIARSESLNGLSADQIVLGMFANSQDWNAVPMIKLGKHQEILDKLQVDGSMASYRDFFSTAGDYILRDEVRRAFTIQPIDKGVYEKELMKVDERLNIASMIYSGRIFKIIPVPNDTNNTWVSNQVDRHDGGPSNEVIAERFFSSYVLALRDAMKTNDYTLPDRILEELDNYQKSEGGNVVPSNIRVEAEILLNKMNVFSRLSVYYLLVGMISLVVFFLSVFKSGFMPIRIYKALLVLMFLGFLFHTLGLGLRWYVSGRAPWSNGYESMIYIAWTTTLAGLIFSRKALGGLVATMVLAATLLLVAGLSYLDPEITPLVPVLKSYWLTIHVSLEAGSYGFLMLGAIIGLINLILMIFLSEKNKNRVYEIVNEMSAISEITLIAGLIMVSVGTYLGGVWANESWGRYWGWDAKETWALVTILVYAFILHMRLIPKINGLYAYNLATLFGWATVIMTYYGVNYYLSGLHSYAAGDPVPIPNWVYIAVISVIIISILAFWRKRKFALIT